MINNDAIEVQCAVITSTGMHMSVYTFVCVLCFRESVGSNLAEGREIVQLQSGS